MQPIPTPEQPPAPAELADVFEGQAGCRLTLGDHAAYQSLRLREPQLVSLADGKVPGTVSGYDAMALWHGEALLGALSFRVQRNPRREAPHDRYARIDVVVVPDARRGVGAGRLLLACATAYLLRTGEAPPYSISCLAAHPAVAHTLESMGYVPRPRAELQYVHEELTVAPDAAPDLARRFADEAAAALRRVRYALRQRGLGPGR